MNSYEKKKINVGVFAYDFFPIFGGQGRHIYEIYRQNRIHKKVNMYIFSPNVNSLKNHISIFPETKKSKFKNIELSFQINKKIENLIEKYDLDIVHIHGGPGGLFLFKKLRVPTMYTVHHTYWQQYHYIKSQSWKYLFYLFEKKSYQFADKIICVSEDTKRIIHDHYSIDTTMLEYIPNGIDLNYFRSLKKLHDHSKEIIYVGRIDKRKGVDFLIRSMRLVTKKDPDITLHIVGEGSVKSNLERYSKANKLPIIFHGRLSDKEVDTLYENIAIQVVPSIFEGFGLSVLEGMGRGVPVIATNSDGIRGIIKHCYSGLLIPYNNEQILANRIIFLVNNETMRKELVQNADSELGKYNWDDIYQKTIVHYDKLALHKYT